MTDTAPAAPAPPVLTPHVRLERVEVVVNPKSGGTGAKAASECETLCREFGGVEWNLVEADPARLQAAVENALAARPDLLVVLAGDGTARTAASLAGSDGPLIAPLPGGTMNMLPKALYGTTDWKQALHIALTEGVSRPVAGGEIEGRAFYCAAILGAPALWAPAREAVRSGAPKLAWLYARRAARRAFSGRIRFRLDDGETHKGEALALITPMISRAMETPDGLEAAVLNLNNAREAFRLAATALFADWRNDAAVETRVVKKALAWARNPIPAILDGESIHLSKSATVKFLPCAFRALAPRVANAAVSLADAGAA
ncbi:MAG TPA: diacylglycerol kinase family protein [Caulobacteraceae bacterium]|nr:diacylglycerol kinase family protein [Caulobacteraceae bacterium]